MSHSEPNSEHQTPPRRKLSRRKLSRRKKAIFALIATLGFFTLLESILWTSGVRVDAWQQDPWVGFSKHVPLFVATEQPGDNMLETASHKLVWFNQQAFPEKKPRGTYRVFSLGGSTTYGRPFRDPTSYTGWLRELLPLADSSRKWEVINAGGVSYASYRVAAVMEELAQYQPDLFIVYTAHNEFLERRTYAKMFEQPVANRLRFALSRTRTWTVMDRLINGKPQEQRELLPAEVDERLNHSVGPMDYHRDPPWTSKVLKHYRLNLSRMAKIAKSSGADILFIAPASNLLHCSPFKSEFSSDVSSASQSQLLELLDQGVYLATGDNPEDLPQALAALDRARAIDAQYAEVEYQRGRALVQMKRYDEALVALKQAVELDVCPLRATKAIGDALRDLPKLHANVRLVDFGSRLEELCQTEHGHRCLGQDYFLDHVHPTIETHRQLAMWILQSMQQSKLLPAGELPPAELQRVISSVEGKLDSTEQGIALRNLAKVLHWAGKFDEAAPRASDALQHLTDDAESLFILAECDRHQGRYEESFELYQRLLDQHPNYSRGLLPYGVVLVELQQFEAAKSQLILGLLDDPDSAFGYHWLGIAHLGLEEYQEAKEALLEADRRNAKDQGTLYYLGVASEGLRQWEDAEKYYRQVMAQSPQHAVTRNRLGWVLVELKRPADAIQQFEAALKIDPSLTEAKENLDFARDVFGGNP